MVDAALDAAVRLSRRLSELPVGCHKKPGEFDSPAVRRDNLKLDEQLVAINLPDQLSFEVPLPQPHAELTGRAILELVDNIRSAETAEARGWPVGPGIASMFHVCDALAIVSLDDEPVKFVNNQDMVGDTIESDTPDMLWQIKCLKVEMSRPVQSRITLEHGVDGDTRTLGSFGFDRSRHALQLYSTKVLHPSMFKSGPFLNKIGGNIPGAHSMRAPEALQLAQAAPRLAEPEQQAGGVSLEDRFEELTPTDGALSQTALVLRAPAPGTTAAAAEAKATEAETVEQSQAEAQRCIRVLAAARERKDLLMLRSQGSRGQGLIDSVFADGSKHVRGKAREGLKSALKKGSAAIEELRALSPAEAREVRASAQLARCIEGLSSAHVSTLGVLFDDMQKRTNWAQVWGPLFDIALMRRSVAAVADGKLQMSANHQALLAVPADTLPDNIVRKKQSSKPTAIDCAFPHLALLLFMENHDRNGIYDYPCVRPRGRSEAIQAFGCTLFARVFPEQVGAGGSVTALSSLPCDPRRDDEQHTLCYFTEADGGCRVVLIDDAGMTEQQIVPIGRSEEAVHGLAPQRSLRLKQDPHERWKMSLEQGAYLSYEVFLPHAELEMAKQAKLAQRVVPDDLAAAHDVWSSPDRKALWPDVTTKPGLLEWYVELASRRQSLLFCTLNFGLRHPLRAHATHEVTAIIDAPELIEAVTRVGGHHQEGAVPFMLPPALDVQDAWLEEAFWQAVDTGASQMTGPQQLLALLTSVAEEDTAALVECVVEVAEGAAEGGGADEQRDLCKELLPWLRDEKILEEQRQRAECARGVEPHAGSNLSDCPGLSVAQASPTRVGEH